MPPDNVSSAKNWLKRAKSNLIRAMMPKPDDVFWEDLCYDAQQCVEKSIKGFLIFHHIKFRYVHDIGELLKTLKINGISYPDEFKNAVTLTDYAVETRYPVISEPVTEEEYKEAVQIAEQVYNWVESEVDKQYKLGI
ncbi:MAG: HEPN domain-containing protein [Syntrophothermus sp.]